MRHTFLTSSLSLSQTLWRAPAVAEFVVTSPTGSAPPFPARLAPGESVEVCGEIRPPSQVNLTSDYNRISYAQWSASFERAGKPRIASASTRISLAE